eukprot:33885-Prorocentrum_minimum.AAC.1
MLNRFDSQRCVSSRTGREYSAKYSAEYSARRSADCLSKTSADRSDWLREYSAIRLPGRRDRARHGRRSP